MKGESAISSWQLAVLLFLSRVMQFFLAAPQNEQPGALTAALLLPASVAVSALLLLPAYFLLRRHPDKGLLDIAGERWGGAGLVYPVAFFLFSLCFCSCRSQNSPRLLRITRHEEMEPSTRMISSPILRMLHHGMM